MISWWGPGEGAGKKKIMKISVAQQKKLDTGVFLVRGFWFQATQISFN